MFEYDLRQYPLMIANPQQQAKLLAALYLAQEQFGWLSPEAIRRVSKRLTLSPGHVRSTASFYTLFKLEPQGKYHIQVCEGLSCYLAGGAEPIIDFLADYLGIQPGETTPDGKITIKVVQCIAACGSAPALRVNDELYENMTQESITDLIDQFREEGE
ncbi:MAG: NAD(P)H-dependent oxidoreductase subunit E [Anaerolineales bacterium]